VAEWVRDRTEDGRLGRDEASSRLLEITDSEKCDNSSNWRPKTVNYDTASGPKKSYKKISYKGHWVEKSHVQT
jgi:hypothetical protein